MEEERRLCYVAMTRAREELYLTCANQRMLFGRTNANRPSRWVEEIPPEHLERSGKTFLSDPTESWGGMPIRTSGYGGYGGGRATQGGSSYGGYTQRPAYGAGRATQKGSLYSARTGGSTSSAPAAGAMRLSKGDMVDHKAFGKGMVLSVQAMGGDALVEIAFDNVGTKRLMLKAASAHMKKL